MIFKLTEEQQAIQEAARDFANTVLLPGVIERDRSMIYPQDQVKQMSAMGFMGMMVDPEFGGLGMDTLSYAIVIEELAKIDASAAIIMSVNNSLVAWGINEYGSQLQKEKYLTKISSGEWMGCFCLSEPEAGSDATSQKTIAEDKGDHYLINGTKNWISNGSTAKLHLVIAQTHPELKHKGINAILVEADTPGVQIGAKEDKMGIRSSDTTSIMYNDVVVPKENRIGPEGFGFKLAMKTLDGGRIGVAAQAVGIAAGALQLSLKYAKERKTFGVPIADHQAIAFKLADMATEVECARQLLYHAAYLKDKGKEYGKAAAMAKVFASEVAMKHTTEAVQIHGGYGYVKEYHVERLMRDAKITQIYEGTSEIQRLVISRSILQGNVYEPIFVNNG
ncbi:MAG: acyl-CoA dehydrogenase family protein [Saprospiraceae bacterium]|nr:acyl-CoA dehydrogenase family protein [Saprospiraceae bacterium]